MSNKAQDNVTYTFDNLVVGSKLLGDARQVEITLPKAFSASNAAGDLRRVSSYDEVNALAFRSGQNLVEVLKA